MQKDRSLTIERETQGRGLLLTFLIVVEVLLLISYIFSFITNIPLPPQIAIRNFYMVALGNILLIGIWRWKMIGAYGFIGLGVLNTIIYGVNLNYFPLQYVWPMLLYNILWILALKRKWHLFS